ncbi:MAG: hypothetical protein ABIQ70_05345 [Dokdonella sp.]
MLLEESGAVEAPLVAITCAVGWQNNRPVIGQFHALLSVHERHAGSGPYQYLPHLIPVSVRMDNFSVGAGTDFE